MIDFDNRKEEESEVSPEAEVFYPDLPEFNVPKNGDATQIDEVCPQGFESEIAARAIVSTFEKERVNIEPQN